ncbi:MAG: proline racemase family protein [Planctomycetota bacterium]
MPRALSVVDTHTGGEPTRIILDLDGKTFPALATGTAAERRDRFGRDYDTLRRAVVEEPRGHEAIVGALVSPPVETGSDSVASVVFFNNRGTLGMCGHGAVGVAVALAHAGRIEPGRHRFDTPAGPVPFRLHEDRRTVTLDNVPAYRLAKDVTVEVAGGLGVATVKGDVAWGGNWFFLTDASGWELSLANVGALTNAAKAIAGVLRQRGVTGANGAEIDHVELFGPPVDPANSARNFVLCPGGAYDRSPCGTGTSAKLACLAADGKLEAGVPWRQESVIGSVFTARYEPGPTTADGTPTVRPTLTADAFVTGENRLLFDPADPFRGGID